MYRVNRAIDYIHNIVINNALIDEKQSKINYIYISVPHHSDSFSIVIIFVFSIIVK